MKHNKPLEEDKTFDLGYSYLEHQPNSIVKQQYYSRYLLEYKGYFSRSYLLLTLNDEEGITIQPFLNEDPQQITKIEWNQIVNVQASERNGKEFTLSIGVAGIQRQTNKQSASLVASSNVKVNVSMSNSQHTVYQCNQRNRLLTEIMQKLHEIKDEGEAQIREVVLYSCGLPLLNSEASTIVLAEIHPTILRLMLLKDQQKPQQEDSIHHIEEELKDDNQLIEIKLVEKQLTLEKCIYLSDLDMVHQFQRQLVITLKDASVETLKFKTEEKCKHFLDILLRSYNLSYKSLLKYQHESFNEANQYIREEVTIIFSREAQVYNWDGTYQKVKFEIGEQNLYQVAQDQRIINKHNLLDLKEVRIFDSHQPYLVSHSVSLTLIFKKQYTITLLPESSYDADRLLSAILTLRSLQMPSTGFIDQLSIYLNYDPYDSTQLIYGLDPLNAEQQTKGGLNDQYESLLVRRLADNESHIDEILINGCFSQLVKVDLNTIRTIMKQVKSCIDLYLSDENAFPNKFEKLVKNLNLLTLLMNSQAFFVDMLEQHEILIGLQTLMIDSNNQYIRLLAAHALKACVTHYSGLEHKAEVLIKKLLISGKQSDSGQQESLLFESIKDYLLKFNEENNPMIKDNIKPCSLSIYAIGSLLRSILCTRRTSTGKTELKIFTELMIEDDERFTKQIQEEENDVVGQKNQMKNFNDPLQNKHMLHIIDNFSKLDAEYFDIQYFFTLMLHETLWYLKRYEMDTVFPHVQDYLLTYTITFLWHLSQIKSKNTHQSKLSIHILSKLLSQHDPHIQLLHRCFPRTLLDKVETHTDNVKVWGDSEWEQFFAKIAEEEYTDKATEHWNNETMQELNDKLKVEIQGFLEAQKVHAKVVAGQWKNGDTLLLPNHEFNRDKRVVSRYQNIKWNYIEFRVEYKCLKNKYLIWKYYLTKLLVDSNLEETIRPYFTLDIEKPIEFWQELKIRLMSSFDNEEQLIILKVMNVLYRIHFLQLKELHTIPYFLKLIESPQYQNCHFILLQLIHIAIGVEDKKISKKNMKMLIKSNGLQVLFGHIKRELFDKNLEQIHNQIANFTTSNTNSRYFRRNPTSVCLGILSIKILDLLFKEFSAIDNVPLPQSREFILKPTSLATLTQILYLENFDMTREMTIFILNHMNNHFFFYSLRHSGMIELLLLILSTKNGDRSLKILQKFQEVSFDYNSNNMKLGQFSANDLKMLQDDKEKVQRGQITQNQNMALNLFTQQSLDKSDIPSIQPPQERRNLSPSQTALLSESILLRFLPVPLIKYFYEKGESAFLSVYMQDFFESPILIWSSSLRLILESSIKEHFASLTQNDTWLSVLDKKFMSIVKYPSIESEVRCGRYYLRVWVEQRKDEIFFDIPVDEEDEFHKNLQAELKLCIYEEQYRDQQKIIILFKACLLALRRFNKKRLFSLEEVKKILIETCKNTMNTTTHYTEIVKQIVYIGIKIIYEVIKTNSQDLKEILTKIGVEIITEVFDLILTQSFIENEVSKVDRYEIKTVSLCIQCFNVIMNTYVQAFIDFPPQQRLNLFKQISKLMEIAFQLLPLFKDKELIEYNITNTVDQQNQLQLKGTQKAAFFDPIFYTTNDSKKSKGAQKLPQIKRSGSIHQLPNVSLGGNFTSQSKGIIGGKKVYERNPDIEYRDFPIIHIIEKYGDRYSIELICILFRSISELAKQLTKNPDLYPDLIDSSIAWKTLKTIFFQLKEEPSIFQDLKLGLRLSTVALKNMISFTHQLTNQGAESFALKSLSKDSEREKLSNFWHCIKTIFAKKIRDTLMQAFVVKNNELVFQSQYNPKYFLQLFSVKAEASSELVWDEVTRNELKNVIDQQIANMQQSSFENILNFRYEVDKVELKVDDIFIRHYNNQNDRYRPQDADKFAAKLIDKLRFYLENVFVSDLSPEQSNHCLLLIKAFNNLLSREQSYLPSIFGNHDIFTLYLDTICSMIKLNPNNDSSIVLPELSESVLDILIQLTVKSGRYISYMMSHDEFIRFLIRTLYGRERTIVKTERVIQVIEIMLTSKEIDSEQFLISQGLIFFIMNQIFDSRPENLPNRIEFVRILLHEVSHTEKIFSSFIPSKFFLEFFSHHSALFLHTPYLLPDQPVTLLLEHQLAQERDKIREFLTLQFDVPRFENVFVIWNDELRKESHERVKYNCDQVVSSYDDSNHQVQWDIAKFNNKYLESEIRVKDVIIRIYNKNPAVFIKEKLNTFIMEVCHEVQKVALEMFKMRQAKNNNGESQQIQSQSSDSQKKFKLLCKKATLLLTALLLSLEQLLFNEFNPNRLLANKKDTLDSSQYSSTRTPSSNQASENRMFKHILEKVTDQTSLDQEVFQLLGFWLQQQVFMISQEDMPDTVKITFLQIVFLFLDVGDSIKVLLDNQSLIQFVNDSIAGMLEGKVSTSVEEFLILLIVYKMLSKDNQIVPLLAARHHSGGSNDQSSTQSNSNLAMSNSGQQMQQQQNASSTMENLLRILSLKKANPNGPLIEMIMQQMASNLQYREHVIGQIRQMQSKIKIDPKLLDTRHEHYEKTIKGIWRPRGKQPPTSSELPNSTKLPHYDFANCDKIEDKRLETNMENIQLPLLSKQSIHCMLKQEIVFIDDQQRVGSQHHIQQNIAGLKKVEKEMTLGYQPMLEGLISENEE